jgi:hypothetical protein
MQREGKGDLIMDNEVIKVLCAPFEEGVGSRVVGGGKKRHFVEGEYVLDRMNKAFSGCWSTEVKHQEVIGDYVLVRVRVTVYDKTVEREFFQEGYGSGDKRGDVANGFKGALTNAIKNACKKWGVGAFLEESGSSESVEAGIVNLPSFNKADDAKAESFVPNPVIPEKKPEKPPSGNNPVKNLSIPPTFMNQRSEKEKETTFKGFNDNKETNEKNGEGARSNVNGIDVSQFASFVNNAEKPNEKSSNVGGKEDKTVATPKAGNQTKEVEIGVENNYDEDGISDVQLAAIEATMEMKNLSWDDFVKGALGKDCQNPPKSPKDLDYQTAITVVRWGNNYGRSE